ncbi:MAG: peptidoglycan editing factor PgeF [Dietzia sp.]|uniref:Purine nucleoside phosphorylase n=1 Tax=Dietzia cercidiphylli TaxID=498199 RepID=A0ABN2IMU3_9ACTN|nr:MULTISPECIES: peptidoglycan editing factor PgeF [Dietzia]MCT1515067.1 peptidoglycan editing factor PgeF [Dietzia cercidiphylli]MDO8395373.1 peptidoglycan editing factor PgeF [Dietzia sp.]
MATHGPGRVRRIITTRRGGVSTGDFDSFNLGDHVGDAPAAVAANRARLARRLGVAASDVVWMDQVHGTRIARVTRPTGGAVPATDGLVTDRPGLALAVLSADCVPVLAADEEAGVIGAAHAGRKGAVGGIVPSLIGAMTSLGARPERISVLLGPAAAGRHYELPDDLADEVEAALPGSGTRTVDGTAGVDLRAGLARQLAGLGVVRVDTDPRCTIADDSLFSYRRQGRTGRQASVILRQL